MVEIVDDDIFWAGIKKVEIMIEIHEWCVQKGTLVLEKQISGQ